MSVAVPLQVPNPRRPVFLQHRSPVWSLPRSSSRHTCSALAQCSLTSRLKVSSTPDSTLNALKAPYMCAVFLGTTVYTALTLAPLVCVNLLQWVIHLNFCWILQKLSRRGGMWDVIANQISKVSHHTIWWGKMERDWNTLLSSSVSSLPTTFLSGFFSNSFQLSLLLLWNKTCLWGKIFLLALLLVFLVSVSPSSFPFPLSFHFFPCFHCPNFIWMPHTKIPHWLLTTHQLSSFEFDNS